MDGVLIVYTHLTSVMLLNKTICLTSHNSTYKTKTNTYLFL